MVTDNDKKISHSVFIGDYDARNASGVPSGDTGFLQTLFKLSEIAGDENNPDFDNFLTEVYGVADITEIFNARQKKWEETHPSGTEGRSPGSFEEDPWNPEHDPIVLEHLVKNFQVWKGRDAAQSSPPYTLTGVPPKPDA